MRIEPAFQLAGICGLVILGSCSVAQDAPPPAADPIAPRVRAPIVAREGARKYPPGRDYMLERIQMIREKEGSQRGNYEFDSNWNTFRNSVARFAGAWQYAWQGSPLAKAFNDKIEASNPEEAADILLSVAKYPMNYDAQLDCEGQRIIAQLLRSGLPALFDSLSDPQPMVPESNIERPGIMHPMPALGDARSLVRFNLARMSLARRRGDDLEFARALRHNLAINHAVSRDASLIAHLVYVLLDSNTSQRIVEEQLAKAMSPELLRAAMALIDESKTADWELSINGERLMVLDAIDWAYQTGRFEVIGISEPTRAEDETIDAFVARVGWATREETLDEFDRALTLYTWCFDDNADLAGKAATQTEEWLAHFKKDAAYRKRFTVMSAAAPAIARAMNMEQAARSTRGAIKAFLAAELFRIEKGHAPESLGELVPGYLPVLPIDWCSPTREPLRYKKLDAKADSLGRAFLIYSVGRDGTDDSGKMDPERPRRAVDGGPEQVWKGYDLVFNWSEQLPDRK